MKFRDQNHTIAEPGLLQKRRLPRRIDPVSSPGQKRQNQ